MYATDRFLDEIRKSHTVVSYVDAITPSGQVIRLDGLDGSVRVDRTAQVRRTCSFTCIDPEGTITPSGPTSDLVPYGTEIRPYRGVKYADGTEEVYPLGVFRLSRVTVEDSLEGIRISLAGSDYSRTIARDKFVNIYTIPAGTNVVAAIQALVERTFPEVEYDLISSSMTTTSTQVYEIEDNPWEAITTLALSLGCEAYFAADGRFVLEHTPSVDGLPAAVFTYDETDSRCTMLDLSQEFSDEPGYNGVVVTGASLGDDLPPVTVVLWDEDPLSPTYHYGPYGENPTFYTDKVAKTEEEVAAVANQILQSILGYSASLDITSMVNPALEAGYAVKVVRGVVGGHYRVESFDVPMSEKSTQSIDVRQWGNS